MDNTNSFLNQDDVVEHIHILAGEIADYVDLDNPSTIDAANFADNTQNLAALVKALEYTTIQSDFFELLKNI